MQHTGSLQSIQISKKPHSIMPQDAWMRFRKDTDGNLYYMNKKVTDC